MPHVTQVVLGELKNENARLKRELAELRRMRKENGEKNAAPPTFFTDLQERILVQPIDEALTMSSRSHKMLRNAGILLVGELVQLSVHDVLMIRQIGRRSLMDIQGALSFYGLSLGSSIPDWNTRKAKSGVDP
jgi:DNA-directed RNA polymerase alpha subunit